MFQRLCEMRFCKNLIASVFLERSLSASYRKLIRLRQLLYADFLPKSFALPCATTTTTVRGVSSLDRHPFLQRFSLVAARPDGDPSLWPPVWDKTQELVLLLRSIRGLQFIFSCDLNCTLHSARTSSRDRLTISDFCLPGVSGTERANLSHRQGM